jgi:hypothetical protein
MKYIVFILFTVVTNAAAQLMLKYGHDAARAAVVRGRQSGPEDPSDRLQPVDLRSVCSTFVISMASHLYVLSKVELSASPIRSSAWPMWHGGGVRLLRLPRRPECLRIAGIALHLRRHRC